MSIRTVASTFMVLPLLAPRRPSPRRRRRRARLRRRRRRPAKPDPKPEAKPTPKPDAKPATAATLAGKWNVSIETPNGAMESALELKADPKDAKKVTGTITSPMGEAALEGEVVDGKLTFWFTMNANGTELSHHVHRHAPEGRIARRHARTSARARCRGRRRGRRSKCARQPDG